MRALQFRLTVPTHGPLSLSSRLSPCCTSVSRPPLTEEETHKDSNSQPGGNHAKSQCSWTCFFSPSTEVLCPTHRGGTSIVTSRPLPFPIHEWLSVFRVSFWSFPGSALVFLKVVVRQHNQGIVLSSFKFHQLTNISTYSMSTKT